MGIRAKLMFPMLLAFGVFAGVLHFYWAPDWLERERQAFIQNLHEILSALEPDVVRHLLASDYAALYGTMDQQLRIRSTHWKQLIVEAADGTRLYPLADPQPLSGNSGNIITHVHEVTLGGTMLARIHLVANPTEHLKQAAAGVWHLEQFLIILFGVIFLFSLLWQNLWVRQPLLHLERAASRLANGDFNVNLPPQHRDEVGKLASAFETMRGNLLRSHEDLKVAATKAKDREIRQRSIFETVADGLVTLDIEGRIEAFNPAAERIFGYGADEVVGHNIDMLTHVPFRKMHDTHLRSFKDAAPTSVFNIRKEVTGQRKDGSQFPMDITVTEMNIGGQRLFNGVLRDITDRKLAEDELEQRHRHLEALVEQRTVRLKDANDELRRFAYIVSHDLRAPLVNIKGFTQELRLTINEIRAFLEPIVEQLGIKDRKELDRLLGTDINESMGFIVSSVSKMNRQTNAILKLSRLGRFQLQPERVDTQALVKDVIRSLAHEIDERGVRVDIDELPTLVADHMAMEQIAGNILDNAIKYLDPGRAGLVAVYSEHSDGNTVLHFRDNGRGISPREQSRIFELFGRAGSQDTPGEGMGLAYVQSLIRRMGGWIHCESALGKGSTFSVAIPDTNPNGVAKADEQDPRQTV